eukprot:3310611-Lingulodinium_polyedra.AAC.1
MLRSRTKPPTTAASALSTATEAPAMSPTSTLDDAAARQRGCCATTGLPAPPRRGSTPRGIRPLPPAPPLRDLSPAA